MGNEISLTRTDLQAGSTAVRARLRAGVSPNKRLLYTEDVGPLPKGCKCTPLGFAILSWNAALLDTLLTAGADPHKPVGLPVRFDFSPLQLAVALGFAAGVRRLLEAGADANAPLQLKRGTTAPPSSPQPQQQTPHSAPTAGADGSGAPAPAAAAATAPVQLLLPDCLARARPGDASLHIAIDCAAEFGVSPESVGGSRMEVVEALIGHLATDLNRPNARGRTPLYKACKRRIEVFVALLTTHPRVNVNAGWPLFAAVKVGSPVLVRALLTAGAEPTCTATHFAGQTALSCAVYRAGGEGSIHRRAEVVALLVQAGTRVDPELVSYAEERGWQGVLAALVSGDPGSSVGVASAGRPAGSTSGAGGSVQRPGRLIGNHVVSTTNVLAAAWAAARLNPRRRGDAEVGNYSRNEGGGGGSGGGPAANANGISTTADAGRGAGSSVVVGDGDGNGSRGGSAGAAGSGVRMRLGTGSLAADRPAAGAPGGGGGARGRRFSFASCFRGPWRDWRRRRAQRPRPPLLADHMRNNPLMMLLLPALFPILIIEAVVVAMAEVFRALLMVLLCGLLLVAPAGLYGLYHAVQYLAQLVSAGVRSWGSDPRGAVGSAGASPGPSFLAGAGAGAGDASGLHDASPPQPLGGAALSIDSLTVSAAAAAPAAPAPSPVADDAAGASLARAMFATAAPAGGASVVEVGTAGGAAAAAAAAVSSPTLAESGGKSELEELLGAPKRAFQGAGGEPPQLVTPHSANTGEWVALEGPDDGHLLRNPLHLEQLHGSCAAATSTAPLGGAAASTAVSSDPAISESIVGEAGSNISQHLAGISGGGGTADVPAGSGLWVVTRLLGVIWHAYLGFLLAIAATILALMAVRLSYEFVESAARRWLPAGGSELGAFLHARARSAYRRGGGGATAFSGSQRESNLTAGLLVAAVALRLFGGASFWTLLRLVAASWAVVEAVEIVREFQQQRCNIPRPGGGGGGSGGSGPGAAAPRRFPEAGSGAGSGDGGGGTAAAAAAPTAAVAGGSAVGGGDGGSGGLDGMCCVCMSSLAVMGFVHRDVVHCCMCVECEAVLRGRGSVARCLICKEPATAVVKVIAT